VEELLQVQTREYWLGSLVICIPGLDGCVQLSEVLFCSVDLLEIALRTVRLVVLQLDLVDSGYVLAVFADDAVEVLQLGDKAGLVGWVEALHHAVGQRVSEADELEKLSTVELLLVEDSTEELLETLLSLSEEGLVL